MPRTRNATPAAYYQAQAPPWAMHAGAAHMYPVPHLAGGHGLSTYGRNKKQPTIIVQNTYPVAQNTALSSVRVPRVVHQHGHKGRRSQEELIHDAKTLARANKIQVLQKKRSELLNEVVSKDTINVRSKTQFQDVLSRLITHKGWSTADDETIKGQIRSLGIFKDTFVERLQDEKLLKYIHQAHEAVKRYTARQVAKASHVSLPNATTEHQDAKARLTSLRH